MENTSRTCSTRPVDLHTTLSSRYCQGSFRELPKDLLAVPFVIFHFPTLSCLLIDTSADYYIAVQSSERKYSHQVKIFELYPYTLLVRRAVVALCPPRHCLILHQWCLIPPCTLGRVQGAIPALKNFAPGVRKVSLHDFLSVLAALWPEIPIRYFPPKNG